MSTPHPIGVHTQDPKVIEGVDPAFLEKGLWMAREKTIKGFKEVAARLEEGMSESTVRRLVYNVFSDLGCKKHWHKPHSRFGAGTILSFNEDQEVGPNFSFNQPAYLDLGPVWYDENTGLDYEGDFGDTFILGHNPEAEYCAKVCRDLFEEAKKRWHENPNSGQKIYEFLNARSAELGFELRQDVCGHRVGDFPHNRHSKMSLSDTNFIPSPLLWVLEVQILDPKKRFGAFFEDLL